MQRGKVGNLPLPEKSGVYVGEEGKERNSAFSRLGFRFASNAD
jgi:hypothetical protein